ncbi:DUF5615 family PIN-like protein [Ruania halotolerans]|uniref:DUF5615 family PIN-like protein n=1 Tax=Ruania halotolerans TaxID=2897773 RepID=UPI001E5D795B|nr:DUF5615 family PIN-like protein [Ruania halotolerans]UFU06613.1 DUF5615 family PIN-like protein [Ruania halotolerans]
MRGDATDHELWAYALGHDAILITKDDDFSTMAFLSDRAPVLLWIRVGNTRRRALLAWFEPLIDEIVRLIEDRQRLIELR